ncbi:hypothetical protein M271_10105 [Streptomyces rapamycinicus NRRL 5491]|nr:hypothetical protein M271_10105 [Streptomyces rapamycinicus NRRL 5491]
MADAGTFGYVSSRIFSSPPAGRGCRVAARMVFTAAVWRTEISWALRPARRRSPVAGSSASAGSFAS